MKSTGNASRSHKYLKPFKSFKLSERNGFFEQLERIERFERLEHTRAEGMKDTKNELKKVNQKHIGQETRKIKFLRPLSFDITQDGELVEPRTLRLNHTKGTAIAVRQFVTIALCG